MKQSIDNPRINKSGVVGLNKQIEKIIHWPLNATAGIRRTISGVYLLFIMIVSLLPSSTFEDIPSLFEHMDKVIHFLIYGGLSALLCWTFPRKNRKMFLYFTAIVLLCTLYGIFMEILQGAFRELDRSFSWGDMIANIAGAIVFIPVKELLLPANLDRHETV